MRHTCERWFTYGDDDAPTLGERELGLRDTVQDSLPVAGTVSSAAQKDLENETEDGITNDMVLGFASALRELMEMIYRKLPAAHSHLLLASNDDSFRRNGISRILDMASFLGVQMLPRYHEVCMGRLKNVVKFAANDMKRRADESQAKAAIDTAAAAKAHGLANEAIKPPKSSSDRCRRSWEVEVD